MSEISSLPQGTIRVVAPRGLTVRRTRIGARARRDRRPTRHVSEGTRRAPWGEGTAGAPAWPCANRCWEGR